MLNLYIDIETIPAQRPDVMADIRESKQAELDAAIAGVKPPGNYKKQETIDAWLAEEAPKIVQSLKDGFEADVDAAYRKTGLDGAYGQICVIGAAFNDSAPITLAADDGMLDEAKLIQDFNCLLLDRVPASEMFTTMLIGHNVAAFDLRFLAQRHIVHGIKPHMVIARAAQAKPWENEKVFDTMVQWAGVGNRISLDKLCKALGIKCPKDGIDGSRVWDTVKDGRLDEVAAYCAKDVEAARQVHLRMTYQLQAA